MFNFANTFILGAITATLSMSMMVAMPAPVAAPLPNTLSTPDARSPLPPATAQVKLIIPEYTLFMNSTDPTDQFFGAPSSPTSNSTEEGSPDTGSQRTSVELFFAENDIESNMVKSFKWTLYTPKDDSFYTRRATPRWQLTCHVSALKGTTGPQTLELLYDAPFLSGHGAAAADSAVRVWCEDKARCVSHPCSGDQPHVDSDDLE
ncbi:hypothetical protein I316_02285 [Kwoniella heveanensis BCC8398]|uniref:Uncharacterized protein n=1 Tax=Kwoniella heveanensis BCC8398 TaxID=1296120 RepID=A0A1B9GXQ2_9TREE|nr:hypothetical protein I316_02285 [Kwoniella heveanensis BCC8398]